MPLFFPNLIIVPLYRYITVENLITNLIDYKKRLYALYTMINAHFLSVARERQISEDKSVAIHTRNLQYLAAKIFKVKVGIFLVIMTEIVKFCDTAAHNLRSGQVLERRHNRTNNFGVESISTFCAKIWAIVPENNQRH